MFDVEGGALVWGAMCVRCALVPGRVAGAAPAGEGARGMGLDLRTMTLTADGFRPAEAKGG